MDTGRSLCLLVGDESADSLSALCRLLRLSGHVVHSAETVESLRAIAAQGHCQIVIVEPAMEDGAALELVHGFKAAGLKTIAITSQDQPQWIDAVEKAGFDHCLLKPIQYDNLLAVLDELAMR